MVAQNITQTKDQSKTFYLVTLHLSFKGITAGSLPYMHRKMQCMRCRPGRSPIVNHHHHQATETTVYGSVQQTLTLGTSSSQTHSPCGTVRNGLSRMGQVHHTAHVVQSATDSHAWGKYITQPMWYSPQRTLTHGTSTSQTDTHSPCDTVRSGLSRIGQVHHRHTA